MINTAHWMVILFSVMETTAVEGAEPWLVHTNVKTIQRLELETWADRSIVVNLTGAVAVDFHYTQGYLYWADQIADRITRAPVSNTDEQEDIVTYSPGRADGIAVDWIYDHLYWVDAEHKHVKVSKLDGTFRKTLVATGLGFPRAIAVHPSAGLLFFTDVITDPKIVRCGLDGSDVKIIVSNKTSSLKQPNGLSIDLVNNRIYWIDRQMQHISHSKFDGTDIQILSTSPSYSTFPWGLTIFRGWIYWTTFSNNTIYRVDQNTGQNFQLVKTGLNQPVGIKIYSQENQPSGTNLCGPTNGGCEQLCLAKSSSAFTCACADGFQLMNDGKRCLNIGVGNWLTFANLKNIERLDVDTSVTEIIATNLTNAVDLDIHYNKGLVYWTDVKEKRIMRTAVTKDSFSGKSEVIIAENVDIPDGIAIDWIYDLLYWTDTGHNHIQVARLDGTHRKTIVKDEGLHEPRAIVVDPRTGWLFFSDWGTNPRIERCRMDGGSRTVIVNNDIVWPNGMSLDPIGGRLYWIDGKLNQIKSTKFDGSDTYTILKNTEYLPKPFDLVVFNNYIYWSNWQYKSIYRINKHTGTDVKQVANYVLSPMGIQMFGPGSQLNGANICGSNNGGCSHMCFPSPAYSTSQSTTYECMCPDFYEMREDKKTCTPIEPPTNIKINATSGHTSIAWTLPRTTDFIIATNVTLHDTNSNAIYTRLVYHPATTLSVSMQLVPCQSYTVKLKCQYSQAGWSILAEEKFWVADDIVYEEEGYSVNVSWKTSIDRSQYNVWFYPSIEGNGLLLYYGGILQQSARKYPRLNKQGRELHLTVTDTNKNDAGLYMSTPVFNSSIIEGCALVKIKESEKQSDSSYQSSNDGSNNGMIMYIGIGAGSLVVLVIIGVAVFCFRRRTNSQNRQEPQSVNTGPIRGSALYDTINEQILLTNNMEKNDSNLYLEPVNSNIYMTLNTARTDSRRLYDEVSHVDITSQSESRQHFRNQLPLPPRESGINNQGFLNSNPNISNT